MNIGYRIETEILQKKILSIRLESTRQFNIKILSTIIDNVHVSSVKEFNKKTNNNEVHI